MNHSSEHKYREPCDCGEPEPVTQAPPLKRGTVLKAVPLRLRDPDGWFLTALARGYGDGDGWWSR
jgi:hypothetical protein